MMTDKAALGRAILSPGYREPADPMEHRMREVEAMAKQMVVSATESASRIDHLEMKVASLAVDGRRARRRKWLVPLAQVLAVLIVGGCLLYGTAWLVQRYNAALHASRIACSPGRIAGDYFNKLITEKQWRVSDLRVVCEQGDGNARTQWVVDRDAEAQTTCMKHLVQCEAARFSLEHREE